MRAGGPKQHSAVVYRRVMEAETAFVWTDTRFTGYLFQNNNDNDGDDD